MANQEIALYPYISRWLKEFLQNKHPKALVNTYDVHSVYLSDFMEGKVYKKYVPEYSTYKIKIDLLGTIIEEDKLRLTIVEVKDSSLTLRDASQLLGYCKVLKPEFAFLISPKGCGKNLNELLVNFRRLDILEFKKDKFMQIAKWKQEKNAIENDSLLPPLGYS